MRWTCEPIPGKQSLVLLAGFRQLSSEYPCTARGERPSGASWNGKRGRPYGVRMREGTEDSWYPRINCTYRIWLSQVVKDYLLSFYQGNLWGVRCGLRRSRRRQLPIRSQGEGGWNSTSPTEHGRKSQLTTVLYVMTKHSRV